MSLYVYCLGEELAGVSLEDLSGVGGARVRLSEFGRLAAVVSDSDVESVAVTAENLRAHNLVNARVLARTTPLPFRFGTLADASHLSDYIKTNESALVVALERVRGRVEMCVKIRWEREKAEGKRQKAKVGSEETEVDAERVGSGTAFLLAKQREIMGDDALRQSADEIASWLDACMSSLVRESAVRVSPSEAIVVRASHLVERECIEAYRTSVRACGIERSWLQFLTSGPWPPYSFSELRR
jgi:hypothetical protein